MFIKERRIYIDRIPLRKVTLIFKKRKQWEKYNGISATIQFKGKWGDSRSRTKRVAADREKTAAYMNAHTINLSLCVGQGLYTQSGGWEDSYLSHRKSNDPVSGLSESYFILQLYIVTDVFVKKSLVILKLQICPKL